MDFWGALQNQPVVPCDAFDSYWIVSAPVQFGLKAIKCTFRFETSFAEAEDEAGTLVTGENRHTIYTLWVSSCDDPSLLYSCRMDSEVDHNAVRYKHRFPSVIKAMIEGANLPRSNPQFSMINLIGDQEVGIFIRLYAAPRDTDIPSSLRLALCTPSGSEWKKHLLMFIETLQNDLCKERWQRELLEKDALCMKSQIAQMERKRGWLEKELEMLHTMIQQQPNMPTLDIHNETEDSPSLGPSTSTSEATQAPEVPKVSPASLPKFSPASPPASPSPPHKTGEKSEHKRKRASRNKDALANDELLIGVASLISCALCPGEVTLQDHDRIKEHFINQHLDGEKGRCRACTEVVSSTDPVSHMKAHLVKQYACEFCGKKGRKHYLKAHIRIHTGEKPYKCDQCPRRFADSSTYRRHQMVHTGEKRYSCPVCGRCIARKDNVKTHMRSHAKNLTVGDTSALMETLNSLCARAEMNAADMHQNAASLLENIGSQNLLGDFNLLESLREDEKKELRSG